MSPITLDAEELIMALEYLDLREAWFRFHNEAFIQLAKVWLMEHQIEATLKMRE